MYRNGHSTLFAEDRYSRYGSQPEANAAYGEGGAGLVERETETQRWARAAQLNRRYAVSLGWGKYKGDIVRLRGFANGGAPTVANFAEAVARWQGAKGLRPDGIIGPLTWTAMRNALSREVSGPGVPGGPATTPPVPPLPPAQGGSGGASGATGFLKDSPPLRQMPLAPSNPVTSDRSWPAGLQRLAATYNRLGGLMSVLARQMGVDVASVLAVWQIESGGRVHVPGSAVIRFENHLFYRLWGRANEDTYNRHFRHGGHAGLPGKSYQNHRFREDPSGEWLPQHGEDGGGQSTEYRVLALARRLAGDGAAIQCISMGGPQILGSNYRGLGYASPRQMYDAFQASEHSHVLGFFDFCRQTAAPSRGALIGYLRDQRWQDFARYYNGPGQVERYGGLLQAAYTQAKRLGI